MKQSLPNKIDNLIIYLSSHTDIVMAFIFGSQVKNQQTQDSDFDLALYFKPQTRFLEWEETRIYPLEDQIWTNVEKIIEIKTDLVVLNRAPATLAYSIIQEGKPILIRDRTIYLDFFLIISQVAEDFRGFIRDFYRIKERSFSIAPVDEARLIRLIDFLESELKDYPNFKNINSIQYETDSTLRRNVERWVENIVNAGIDMAKILLASEKRKIPQTYQLALQELSFLKNFSPEVAERLSRFTKLKNILAHDYMDVRLQQILEFIQNAESAYLELINFSKKKVLAHHRHDIITDIMGR